MMDRQFTTTSKRRLEHLDVMELEVLFARHARSVADRMVGGASARLAIREHIRGMNEILNEFDHRPV